MDVHARPYSSVDDLRKIQMATADWIRVGGFQGYLHVEDIALRLFNGMRRYKPEEIVRLWEDTEGNVLGWGMVYPRWNSYDVQLHPNHQSGNLATQILDWAESETWASMQTEGKRGEPITLNVYEGDTARISLLEQRGYVRGDLHGVIATRSLAELIPHAPLPDGFVLRTVTDEHEAEKIVEAQNASFGWTLSADEYRRIMQSPGFKHEQHLVIAAPDNRIAAFCYLLLDDVNRLGMFEDVGTHPEFQRQGFGRALLFGGMRWMREMGMQTAMIPYSPTNIPPSKLYTSVGFGLAYNLYDYVSQLR